MEKTYISITEGDISRQVLMVTYTSEGGFILNDLVRCMKKDGTYMVMKFLADTQHNGLAKRKPFYQAATTGNAKLTHHFDGNAQISGSGVISGFESDGKPRGAALHSLALNKVNDGGPIFSYLVWGLEGLRPAKISDVKLVPTTSPLYSRFRGQKFNAYLVKGFYIPKTDLPKSVLNGGKVLFKSSVAGTELLTVVPSPEKTPGVLCVNANLAYHGFTYRCGFTLGAAPGFIDKDGFCPQLALIYPYDGEIDKYINLDYIPEAVI